MARNNKKVEEPVINEAPKNDEELKAEQTSGIETTPEENVKNSDEVITEHKVENSDGDVKADEPKMEAPKMQEFKKLICKVSFTDKFDKTTVYEVNEILNITDVARRNDLIRRGLAVEE